MTETHEERLSRLGRAWFAAVRENERKERAEAASKEKKDPSGDGGGSCWDLFGGDDDGGCGDAD